VPGPEQIRRLIACLCVAAILVIAVAPASWGLLLAVLAPIFRLRLPASVYTGIAREQTRTLGIRGFSHSPFRELLR
jgi:hypothetical protein